MIFLSKLNITRLLIPVTVDGDRYIETESSIPSIFFTVSDPTLEGGACIYVLKDLAAYEILEGGRDSTSDYSNDTAYDPNSISATKLVPFKDDIIQLQKAKGIDKIYILTYAGKLAILEKNGTVRTNVKNVVCAAEFVLDTSNNIHIILIVIIQ
ncbi:Uncharacterized protein OBRU01_03133 [Operophtera brumata]|uniref:Uncharacterized protein n=1 Tax=Operophtera brumata TaxID=104452 RepID=A0A0L7LQB9_OPEBR|nr:Uncharacterized protein OBRU01_03133 [Operophtera brumata]